MLNKAMIIGNLGRDPETRYTKDGKPVTSFSVATTEKWKSKDGAPQEKTEWHNVSAFGRLAEICGEYLTKGSRVYVEGKLSTSKYEQDGVTKYSTQIIANSMQMLGGGSQGSRPAAPRQEGPAPATVADDFDDDIPF